MKKTYNIVLTRVYVTEVSVKAESKDEARIIANQMLTNGELYREEYEQCNVVSETLTVKATRRISK